MMTFNPDSLSELLPIYYKRLFPVGPFQRWISYGNVDPFYFCQREFSFTLEGDIYLRYKSYLNGPLFQQDLLKHCPVKIDIGAVYNVKPSERRSTTSFQPLERELVFDIDMTDYDDVRTCCSDANVCPKCWQFMVVACKTLDCALRDDFGYKHLLWVFSGRRGVHCWVCDAAARKLDVAGRSAVAEYLQIVSGGESRNKKVILSTDKLHSSIKRAVAIAEKHFIPLCIEGQDILGTPERIAKVLSLVADETLRHELDKLMNNHSTSLARWKAFTAHVSAQQSAGSNKGRRRLNFLIEEIMLQYTYPRLDIHVTKGLNHLLKAPFCVHPKTGKVCTPFNPRVADKFNPDHAPTITQLIDEVTKYDADVDNDATKDNDTSNLKRLRDYKKTSLNKSIVIFEEFLRNLEDTWKRKNINGNDISTQL